MVSQTALIQIRMGQCIDDRYSFVLHLQRIKWIPAIVRTVQNVRVHLWVCQVQCLPDRKSTFDTIDELLRGLHASSGHTMRIKSVVLVYDATNAFVPLRTHIAFRRGLVCPAIRWSIPIAVRDSGPGIKCVVLKARRKYNRPTTHQRWQCNVSSPSKSPGCDNIEWPPLESYAWFYLALQLAPNQNRISIRCTEKEIEKRARNKCNQLYYQLHWFECIWMKLPSIRNCCWRVDCRAWYPYGVFVPNVNISVLVEFDIKILWCDRRTNAEVTQWFCVDLTEVIQLSHNCIQINRISTG